MSTLNDVKYPGDRTIGWALMQAARLHRTHLNTKLANLYQVSTRMTRRSFKALEM